MNRLTGTLKQLRSLGDMSEAVIAINECIITAIVIDDIPGIFIGSKINMVFKESETAIACLLPSGIVSIRNRLPCTVVAIQDDTLLASVSLDFNGNRIESLITSASASELCLRPGKNVFALIKSTEVMIERA